MSFPSRTGRRARIFIANTARSSATTISTLPSRDTGTPSRILARGYELLRREIEPVFAKPSAMRGPSRPAYDILGLILTAYQRVLAPNVGSSVDRRRASPRSTNERSAESLLPPALGTWPDETVRRSTGGRRGAELQRGTTLTWSVSPIHSATGVPQLRPNALVEVESSPTAEDGKTLKRGDAPLGLSITVSL
jgi:hypothetical protein